MTKEKEIIKMLEEEINSLPDPDSPDWEQMILQLPDRGKKSDEKKKRFRIIAAAVILFLLSAVTRVFFASKNSPVLQKLFPRHRWGIFMLT